MTVSPPASSHLNSAAAEQLDPLSKWLLQGISLTWDAAGFCDINLYVVGAATMVLLLTIRVTCGKYRGVDWYALLHALVTGYGSGVAVYLDAMAAQTLTGLEEPLRSCLCHGPWTSLHRVLPAITMGYSLFDLLDGLTLGWDFALHGAMTLFVMAVFCITFEAPHVVTPFLLMEVSTIHLACVRADFLSPVVSLVNQAMFAFLFFLFRIVVCPYLWFQLVRTMQQTMLDAGDKGPCFSPFLFPTTVVTGILFHCLNAFWFYKILRKIKRKASGKEAIQANNDLKEKEGATQSNGNSSNGHVKKNL